MGLIAEKFASRFLGVDKTKVEDVFKEYAKGVTTCGRCKTVMSFTNCTPLSLVKCPRCDDLIFVPLRIEEWWVMEPIGAGGFGSVYLARSSENPEIKAAVKVLQRSSDIDNEIIQTFQREAEIAYSLKAHPHLMETHAMGSLDDGALFMIMEFIEGDRLSDYISMRGRIPPEEALYYTLDMLSALEFIRNSGFVYRDMKPENVIIKKTGMATIIDFGLCLKIEESMTPPSSGLITGSALFMPPERCFRKGEDHRSDIYSLGMVLCFSLIGESFFSRNELKTAVRAHMMKMRIQTQSRMEGCDPNMVGLVDKMIKREPEDRFQTFEEARMAIFSILAGYQQTKSKEPLIIRRRQHFLDTYGELRYE